MKIYNLSKSLTNSFEVSKSGKPVTKQMNKLKKHLKSIEDIFIWYIIGWVRIYGFRSPHSPSVTVDLKSYL